MSRATKVGAVLLLCMTAACGHLPRVQSRVVTGALAPAYRGDVRILMQGEPPPSEYVEVALVKAMNDEGRQHALADLKQEAASLGCDTLVNVVAESPVAFGVAVRTPLYAAQVASAEAERSRR